MAAKKEETTLKSNTHSDQIHFIQIMGDADAIYALDKEGRVFIYVDDEKSDEYGWYQLEHDDSKVLSKSDEEEGDED